MKFRSYRPQPPSVWRLLIWLRQYNFKDWNLLADILEHVHFITTKEIEKTLVDLNARLLEKLKRQGIEPDHVIYMSIDEAGSSSPVMLNLLRDAARLPQLGCHFLDSHQGVRLGELTTLLHTGAVIYVDDFSGTGKQFCDDRDEIAQSIQGSFEEYLLLPWICEESVKRLGARGIDPIANHVDSKVSRPLHELSSLLPAASKQRLLKLCTEISPYMSLGFFDLATMVVFEHNCPDTTPLILRGSEMQTPMKGILPRTSDLPPHMNEALNV